ncbi:MAG: aminoacyl-histidine dipeptidase [Tannerella sp.]|jgi:dipeptidase D|nr:aminoacyl-histidine dipeptidase [Tannerella sp.]
MNIEDLEPKIVWDFFHQITQVPRPSGKEERIIAFLESFAKEHGLEYKKDEVGNILIRKPATAGRENRPSVILQSHVDMVCEKNADTVFDFDKDPIRTVVDGNWVRAEGTTLGADNGIGVATELAILASDDIEHGPLECLFTVDEERGLTGANAIKPGFMNGKILLNLDSEDEGELFIGCAGGGNLYGEIKYELMTPPSDIAYFRFEVKGLKGGHSGSDIHLGLGNANKVLARFLYCLMMPATRFHVYLHSFKGGNLHNAIPREATAVVGIPSKLKEEVRVLLNHFIVDVESELKQVDPGFRMEMSSVETPEPNSCLNAKNTCELIYCLNACPHGVLAMSHDMPGLVETSTNLAAVNLEEGLLKITTSQRSSLGAGKRAAAIQVTSAMRLADLIVTQSEGYPGWAPNPQSPILKLAVETYKQLFGKEPAVKAIHAGLECGLFLAKYPDLDMISFGPTLRDVHSPNERIQIDTVGRWWKHLLELLRHV